MVSSATSAWHVARSTQRFALMNCWPNNATPSTSNNLSVSAARVEGPSAPHPIVFSVQVSIA